MQEWSRFWLAISLMLSAGAIFFAAGIGWPAQLGPVAQWVAATATTGAVIVALLNTDRTLRETAARERAKESISNRLWVAALLVLTGQGRMAALSVKTALARGGVDVAKVRQIIRVSHVRGVVAGLDRIPLHTAPDPALIDLLGNVRISMTNIEAKLLEHIDYLNTRPTFPATANVDQEFELADQMYRALLAEYAAQVPASVLDP